MLAATLLVNVCFYIESCGYSATIGSAWLRLALPLPAELWFLMLLWIDDCLMDQGIFKDYQVFTSH
jgi:hypothetical protein